MKNLVCQICYLAGLLLFPVLALCQDRESGPVAVINGLSVSEAEYRLVMNSRVAEVIGEYNQKQGLEDHLGYWSERMGPDAPVFRLREMVTNQLIEIKVIQALAMGNGLLLDPSYERFEALWKSENDRRENAGNSGEIVYGPRKFSEMSYYFIRQGELDYKVARILANEFTELVEEADAKSRLLTGFQN